MLFEEFFKKKKISLEALQHGDAVLFLEFKEHFEQMGEKSFDHTKKYWFNKLRRLYPLPPEIKAEKLRPENPMAEQTVADTLTEPAIPGTSLPKPGFKPRFKAATLPQQQEAGAQPTAPNAAEAGNTPVNQPDKPEAETPMPAKPGFKPRFKAGVTSASTTPKPDAAPGPEPPVEPVTAAEQNEPQPKLGFKPRFKAGVTNAKPAAGADNDAKSEPDNQAQATSPDGNDQKHDDAPVQSQAAPAQPKLGFKPRFKAGVTNVQPSAETVANDTGKAAEPETKKEEETPAPPAPEATAKPAYKPRFNPGMIKKPKPPVAGE